VEFYGADCDALAADRQRAAREPLEDRHDDAG